MNGLAYIRQYYKVPAYKGKRVQYTEVDGKKWKGTITSAEGTYLRIKKDGDKSTYFAPFHPTYNIEYLEENKD